MRLPQHPAEIREDFHEVIKTLRDAKEPLSLAELQRLSLRLGPAYNLVSAQVRQPGIFTVLQAQAAHGRQVSQELAKAEADLERHRVAVRSLYEGASQYLRSVQAGLYAAAFAIWAFTRQDFSPQLSSAVALLLIFSSISFGVWELTKSALVSFGTQAQASLTHGSLEAFLRRRDNLSRNADRLATQLPSLQGLVWLLSVVPAAIAVALMVGRFVALLIGGTPAA